MPSLLGLAIIAIGLVMIHYGVTGQAFPLAPVAAPYAQGAAISKVGSVTSLQ